MLMDMMGSTAVSTTVCYAHDQGKEKQACATAAWERCLNSRIHLRGAGPTTRCSYKAPTDPAQRYIETSWR